MGEILYLSSEIILFHQNNTWTSVKHSNKKVFYLRIKKKRYLENITNISIDAGMDAEKNCSSLSEEKLDFSLRISTIIPSFWFLFKSSVKSLNVLSAFGSFIFFWPSIFFSFVFLLIRRGILLLPSTMSLKELRKGLFISVVLIPFSYGCAQCLKWWERLHVVSEYIYFDKLSRDETWRLPYFTFLSVMSFQFQSSFVSSMSSSFPTVKLQWLYLFIL